MMFDSFGKSANHLVYRTSIRDRRIGAPTPRWRYESLVEMARLVYTMMQRVPLNDRQLIREIQLSVGCYAWVCVVTGADPPVADVKGFGCWV
jgi:hypothetical protein